MQIRSEIIAAEFRSSTGRFQRNAQNPAYFFPIEMGNMLHWTHQTIIKGWYGFKTFVWEITQNFGGLLIIEEKIILQRGRGSTRRSWSLEAGHHVQGRRYVDWK